MTSSRFSAPKTATAPDATAQPAAQPLPAFAEMMEGARSLPLGSDMMGFFEEKMKAMSQQALQEFLTARSEKQSQAAQEADFSPSAVQKVRPS